MFHNISRIQNIDNDEMRDNNDIYRFLQNIFNIKNILIYIISFYISIISIKGKMNPFGLSILAASVCTQIPILGVLVATSIGIICASSIGTFIKYVITIILFLTMNVIIKPKKTTKDRNELYKLTYRLIFINLIIQLFGTNTLGFGNRLLYSIVHSAFVYIGYKICISGIATIKNIGIKKAFSNLELISAGVLVSILLLMNNNFMIFNINITNVLLIALVFYISYKNGYICGGISGLAIGLVGLLLGKSNILFMINLCLTGTCCGLFNDFRKTIALGVIILANIIFSGILQGNIQYFINIPGAIILFVLHLFIEEKSIDDLDNIMSSPLLLEEKFETSLTEAKVDNVDKTSIINDTIEEQEKDAENRDAFVKKFYQAFKAKNKNILYDKLNNDTDIVISIYEILKKNEAIEKDELIDILSKNDYYILSEDKSIKSSINEIIKIANKINKSDK